MTTPATLSGTALDYTNFVDRAVAERHVPLFAFAVNHDVNRALNEEMDRWDATTGIPAQLALIDGPVLMIHGGGDPRPAPVSIAEALPRAELVLIADAGHLPWMERLDEVAAALRRFLSASAR